MQDIAHDMGKHEAQIDHLEREVEALRRDVREIKEILDQANGGWRVIMWVAGASGAAGAAVSWVASKMHMTQ
jgi:outer membrane murein-binding lipoprotein Lpp